MTKSANKIVACSVMLVLLTFTIVAASAQPTNRTVKLIEVGEGWAANSINAVVFRKNSLISFKDTQFIAYYNKDKVVMLGKRKLAEDRWMLKQTAYAGNASDAHNSISLMVDGDGFLHLAWDHHNNPLRYAKSNAPGSLELTEKMPMTGNKESRVSYPEFYKLPSGDLLFFYRDGGSGNGNLVINKYNLSTKSWKVLQQNLIDGEGKHNAYWQACVDAGGAIHVSWVWRESTDVASNHDMAYACSKDGGETWQKSDGTPYSLPITKTTAEYAARIPQRSELINQTSMTTDDDGNPFIVTYWREASSTIPQYHVIYLNNKKWQILELGFRKRPFSLSGQGSKRIPIARPQLLIKGRGAKASGVLIFRDEERGNKVSVASISSFGKKQWKLLDLTTTSVGSWEPTFDTELWKTNGLLNLFVQAVEQVDAEGLSKTPPQSVQVLEWKPKF